jgi:predicted permease
VTFAQAQKDLSGLALTLAGQFPENVGLGAVLEPLRDAVAGPIRPALLLLLGAVALVLLIACANLANLLLARGAARTREIAVRAALGATRGRIIRQMLAESVLLAAVGGAAGCVLANWALAGISALGGEALAHLPPLRLDVRVLGFAAGLSVVTGLLFGLAPALLLSRHTLADALRAAAPSVAPRAGRLRSALVVAEVALSVALLAGAGLLLRSLDRLAHVDPGFDAAHVITASLRLPARRYPDAPSHLAFLRELMSRVRALPSVSSVGIASQLPLKKPGSSRWITAEGEPEPVNLDAVEDCNFQFVAGDYFAALRLQLARGRFPDPNEKGIVLNEAAAKRLFGGKDAVGRRVWLGPPERFLPSVREPYPRYVVTGVVRDVRSRSLVRVPRSEAWLHFEQSQDGLGLLGEEYVIARSAGAPGPLIKALRDTVRALDSEQALGDVRTMDERVGAAMAQQRFSTSLLTLFAGLALALAVVGVYAVMAYTVAQRTREIGVRMALGAAAGDVLRLVFRQGLVLVGSGLLIGVLGALAASRAVSALLFGISATDPMTYAVAAAVQVAVGALALYLPARRASRLHPAVALRAE